MANDAGKKRAWFLIIAGILLLNVPLRVSVAGIGGALVNLVAVAVGLSCLVIGIVRLVRAK